MPSRTVLASLLAVGCLLVAACGKRAESPVARGRDLFHRVNTKYGCVQCHGPDAKGIANTAPSLHGLGDVYLKKFGGDRKKAIGRLVEYLKSPLSVGPLIDRRRGFSAKMPPYRALPEADLEALAAYVMSLR